MRQNLGTFNEPSAGSFHAEVSCEKIRPEILLAGVVETDFAPGDWKALGEEARVRVVPGCRALRESVSDAVGLVVAVDEELPADLLASLPSLRFVVVHGTSLAGVDVVACAERGVRVANAKRYSRQAVAEFAVGAMLDRLRALSASQLGASAEPSIRDAFRARELHGLRVGIVGLGNIGGHVAKILRRGFGASISYWSRTRKPRHERLGVTYRPLEDLMAWSDWVVVALPLTPQTRGLLSTPQLRFLRPDAVLLHLSPMEILDVPAVDARLAAGQMSLVADHSDEIPPPLLRRWAALPNCTLYPPVAYLTEGSFVARSREVRSAVLGLLRAGQARALADPTPQAQAEPAGGFQTSLERFLPRAVV